MQPKIQVQVGLDLQAHRTRPAVSFPQDENPCDFRVIVSVATVKSLYIYILGLKASVIGSVTSLEHWVFVSSAAAFKSACKITGFTCCPVGRT